MVMNFERAKHLTVRTGLGPELHTISQYARLSRDQAVSKLLSQPINFSIKFPHLHGFNQLRIMRSTNEKQRVLAGKLLREDSAKLQNWAVQMLLDNPNALHERMTWFWHNHFTSSLQRSQRTVRIMKDQTILIRKHALGDFSALLKEIAYDPMMLVYLDAVSNLKGKPNENFARELLELFTLGEGYYSESDIKETARAFTGWRIHPKTEKAFRTAKLYDDGVKTIFTNTGRFDSDDVLEMLLSHPRVAELIAEKFWYEFVSIEKPQSAIVKQWAHIFRSSNYNISSLLYAVFTSESFWAQVNRAKLIKTPIDIIIGTLRTLELEDNSLPASAISRELRKMGQELYRPPNVKGWPGGLAWIDGQTLPQRKSFLRKLVRGSGNQRSKNMQMGKGSSMMQGINMMKEIPNVDIKDWGEWLLQAPSVTNIDLKSPQGRLQAILLDPTYQLK